MRIRILALIAALALAAPRAARAADGTTDLFINPATGATISVSGSYRLVSNVTMTADVPAVTVSVSDVTLDLGGHTINAIAGSTGASGITCSGIGFTVHNGAIKGWGDSGIQSFARATVRGVRIEGNNVGGAFAALSVGVNSRVEDCVVVGNSPAAGVTQGINAGAGSQILRNIVDNNDSANSQSIGIIAGNECLIEGNTVLNNTGSSAAATYGINANFDGIVRGNLVRNNDNLGAGDAVGIAVSSGSLVEHNHCSLQSTGTSGTASAIGIFSNGGPTVVGNDCRNNIAGAGTNGNGIGISVSSRAQVKGNRCDGNGGVGTGFSCGIMLNNANTVEGNTCVGNTGGALSHGIRVTNGFNLVARNSTIGHTSGGMIFLLAANNRCHSNDCREAEAIESTAPGVAPSSIGAGDLANVIY